MAFFRVKKIKENEYSYLVENEWKKKGSRQKVKEYAGRIYRFELKNSIEFPTHLKIDNLQSYIDKNSNEKIKTDLVEWELFKFGVDKQEFNIDLGNKLIRKKNKNVCLLINDGFMCHYTLRNLLDFKPEGDDGNDGYRLARAFVEAGIKVPQEVFVGLFSKLIKE